MKFRKLSILSLAAALTIPMFANASVNISGQDAATPYAVDADGYNVLGSVVSASVDGNKVNLSVNTGESIRFTFLEQNVFRMYMAPEGEEFKEYPTPNSADHTATITNKSDAQYETEYKVKPTLVSEAGKITIKTDKVTIEIDELTSIMKVMKADGTIVWEETAPLKYKTGSTVQTLKTNPTEYFYGGGTQNGRFSHKGKSVEILNSNNWVDKGVASPNPFYWSTGGYGVVRNTWKPGTYDFASKESDAITTTHKEKRFDAYYFIDDTPVDILGDYYELTGAPAELPEYASYLGHLNCYNRDYWLEVAEGTSGAVKLGDKWYKESQSDNGGVKESLLGEGNLTAQQIIEDHKDNDMPLGWFLPNDGYGCGYGQTTSQAGDIENLKDFSDYAIENGVQTGLWTQSNLWPAVPSNPQKGERDIYKEVEAGVHSVKTDVAWVGAGYSMALNGISVAYDAIASRSGLKPNIVTLDGWAGTQRYGGIWSGDQSGGQWEYIRFHIPTYIGTSLSGQPNIGSDVDGIFGGKNATIQTRDFQWKAFTTYMLDMDGWGSNQKSPWALGEDSTSINRAYLKLKAELMPYINTISHTATAKGGLPMLRAMFLEEANAFTLGTSTEYQYMWGDNFLVAPIYQNTAADAAGNDIRNDIYLPGTSDVWIDYFTGEHYRGGQILNNFDSPIWKLPIFVKNGSIIPMYSENNNPEAVSEKNTDGLDKSERIVEFYPHGETEFSMHEDDGLTLGGASTTTLLTSKVDSDKAILKADKTVGNYTGMVKERSTEFVVNVSEEPNSVSGKVAGESVNFTKVTTQEEYDKAKGNVYFYNATPDIFVKKYATKDTTWANTNETTRPKVYVKSAEKVDITTHGLEVSINGFKNEQNLGEDSLNEALSIPTGLSAVEVSDSEITMNWDTATEATTYDIEMDGNVYRNIKTTNFKSVGLDFLTEHTYKVRAVNATGYSAWSEGVDVKTSDNPYRNVPSDLKVTWDHGASWGAVKNAFDHDQGTMFHSTSAVTPNQMMTIDMGAAYQMDKFTYQPRMDNKGNGTVTRMDVFASLDGINYKKVWDGADNPAWTYSTNMDDQDIKEIHLDGLKARYLKLSVVASKGGFFSAAELTPYKKDGTDAWVVGDVNNSGSVDDNDLVFYENYVGLKPVDNDWEYSALGNIDNNDIIDAYDISFVARMLGEKITSPAKGVEGKVQIIPSKTDIKAGDLVTLDFYGIALKNVNAFSFEMPVDMEQFEVVDFGSPTSASIFMRNFSKTRFHNDGTVDNYACFTNVGKQDLINGTGSLAKVTIRATKDFTWDTKATRANLVGQDLSTADALIDNTITPVLPQTESILKLKDIESIKFDNDVKQDMDGSELWQQENWKDILFDGDKTGTLAEFKWYLNSYPEEGDIEAEVKLPTDIKVNFKNAVPLTKVKIYNRAPGSNGSMIAAKVTGYDGETAYDLGTISTAQAVYEFKTPEGASKIDRVVISALSSSGKAKGTTSGTEENRMLSLYEVEFVTDTAVNATGIEFNANSAKEVYVGAMAEVSAKVAPDNVSNPFYSITSSDESIAKVIKIPTATDYKYVIQGIAEGEVTLTATSEDGNHTKTMSFKVAKGINTTTLSTQLDKAKALYENLYTSETWSVVKDAMAEATIIIAESESQAEVDAMTSKMIKAMSGLKFKGSNTGQESSQKVLPRSGMSLYDESSFTAVEKEHGDRVLDGDISTFWHSNYNAGYTLPQWVTIDMGAEYELEQIDYLPRQNSKNGQITHYRVEVSGEEVTRDGEKVFTPVVEGYFESDDGGLVNPSVAKEVKIDKTKARYVRFIAIESLGNTPNMYASIAELNFYGDAVIDEDALTKAIEDAEVLIDGGKEDVNTTSSWALFMSAYEAAVALDVTTATPAEIKTAIDSLKLTTLGLEKRASIGAINNLKKLVADCKAKESEYTVEQFAVMKELLEDADVILGKDVADISLKEVSKINLQIIQEKLKLEQTGTANEQMKALRKTVEIAEEVLAEDLSNIRPGKVQNLRDAVAAGKALVAANSTDKEAISNASNNILKAMNELWEIVDKEELDILIAQADGMEEAIYTESSWDAMQGVLTEAKLVAANGDATGTEVEEALTNLYDALYRLEMIATLNKDALADKIAKASIMVASIDKYVASTVKTLPAALASAKIVHDNATKQAEIDAATDELITAIAKARLKADKTVLLKTIDKARKIDLAPYTVESGMALTNAVKNAEVIVAKEEATTQEVEMVVTAIDSAIGGLKKLPAGTNSGSNAGANGAHASNKVNGVGAKTGDQTDVNALLAMMLLAAGTVVAGLKKRSMK